jgi:transcriptional regulator with XRE-family HTH domain
MWHVKQMGPRLRNAREAMNLSRQEMARLLGVTESAIGAYECGRNAPNADRLCRVCRMLGVSPNHLLKEENEQASV